MGRYARPLVDGQRPRNSPQQTADLGGGGRGGGERGRENISSKWPKATISMQYMVSVRKGYV